MSSKDSYPETAETGSTETGTTKSQVIRYVGSDPGTTTETQDMRDISVLGKTTEEQVMRDGTDPGTETETQDMRDNTDPGTETETQDMRDGSDPGTETETQDMRDGTDPGTETETQDMRDESDLRLATETQDMRDTCDPGTRTETQDILDVSDPGTRSDTQDMRDTSDPGTTTEIEDTRDVVTDPGMASETLEMRDISDSGTTSETQEMRDVSDPGTPTETQNIRDVSVPGTSTETQYIRDVLSDPRTSETESGHIVTNVGTDDEEGAIPFVMEDKKLVVPKKIWMEFDLVSVVEDLYKGNKEPFKVKGFKAGTMRHLMRYMENGQFPAKAEDIRDVVKLAFFLQFKGEVKICSDILALSRLNAEATETLEMLSDEENVTILECVFPKSNFDSALDTFYRKCIVVNKHELKFAISQYILDQLGDSKKLVNFASKNFGWRLGVLDIPEDIVAYGKGKPLPEDLGHLVVTGDINEVIEDFDENLIKKLDEELRSLTFSNLIVLDYTVIPQFLKEEMNAIDSTPMKRQLDRLWVNFKAIKPVRLPAVVERFTSLLRLDCYAEGLDFSRSGCLAIHACEQKFQFNEDTFKYTHTLIVKVCHSVDLKNANIGSVVKHLDLLSSPFRRVLLPQTVQVGLEILKLKVMYSAKDDTVLDLREWDLSRLEILRINCDRPHVIMFNDEVYKIEGLTILGMSYNLFDLSGAVQNSWKKLKRLILSHCWGHITLPSTEQLNMLRVKCCGMKEDVERELVLCSSVIEGVADIEISYPEGNIVFPKTVSGDLNNIVLRCCYCRTALPEDVVGNIVKLEFSETCEGIDFPKSVGGHVFELKVIGADAGFMQLAKQELSIPAGIIERTKELNISNCNISVSDCEAGRRSALQNLIVDSGGICLKGWLLPDLETISGNFRGFLSLPALRNMPKLKRRSLANLYGKLLLEGHYSSLDASELRNILLK